MTTPASILFGRHRRREPQVAQPQTESDGGSVYLNVEQREDGCVEFWTLAPCGSFEEAQQRQLLHRHDGPAVTIEAPGGSFVFHPPDSPPVAEVAKVGGLHIELWYDHGQPHREDGPAEVVTYDDGQYSRELYLWQGQRHRYGEPAETHWHPDGQICMIGWWEQGRPHNELGPALIEEGIILECAWFLHGEELSEEEWIARTDE